MKLNRSFAGQYFKFVDDNKYDTATFTITKFMDSYNNMVCALVIKSIIEF